MLATKITAGEPRLGNLSSPELELTKTREQDQNLKVSKTVGTLMFVSILSSWVRIQMQKNLCSSVEQDNMNPCFSAP